MKFLWGYAGNVAVNLRFEEVNIVVIGKISCWQSVPQSNSFWEEAVQMELISYYRNMKRMGTIHSCVRGMAGPSCNGWGWSV